MPVLVNGPQPHQQCPLTPVRSTSGNRHRRLCPPFQDCHDDSLQARTYRLRQASDTPCCTFHVGSRRLLITATDDCALLVECPSAHAIQTGCLPPALAATTASRQRCATDNHCCRPRKVSLCLRSTPNRLSVTLQRHSFTTTAGTNPNPRRPQPSALAPSSAALRRVLYVLVTQTWSSLCVASLMMAVALSTPPPRSPPPQRPTAPQRVVSIARRAPPVLLRTNL